MSQTVQAQLEAISDDRERYETALRLITNPPADIAELSGAAYALYVNLVANLALKS